MELQLITGDRFGDWETHQALVAQETALLERLHADLLLQAQLVPVQEADLCPGLVLIYRLGKNTFGCHAIRDRASGYKYLPDTDIRSSVRAGRMFTLP